MIKWLKNGVTAPKGFKAAGMFCGIKKSRKFDLGMLVSEKPCSVFGMFTQNRVKAASVIHNARLVRKGTAFGVVVNSGNANACTGAQGMKDVKEAASLAERTLGLPAHTMFVNSTGVIGHPLPMPNVRRGIRALGKRLSTHGSTDFARAIITTDLRLKTAAVEFSLGNSTVRIGGACKGSGMINPNLATMLAFFTTDANIPRGVLGQMFRQAVGKSFNCITVDGDSSTNDSVLLLANGMAQNKPLNAAGRAAFARALTTLMVHLAQAIAADGEGATKLVEIVVRGALTQRDAACAAKAVANSPLVKTALYGNDPNVGRILCAAGYSGARFNGNRLGLKLCDTPVVKNSQLVRFNAKAVSGKLKKKKVRIEVDLGSGACTATVWTCDFSYDYVKINAEYHT